MSPLKTKQNQMQNKTNPEYLILHMTEGTYV